MRQFITWRFWLTVLVLVGLTALLVRLRSGGDSLADSVVPEPERERDIDLIVIAGDVRADPGFSITRGITTARMQIVVDGARQLSIAPGTPGENRCPTLDVPGSCAVAVDLLGDAVLWFTTFPADDPKEVTVPGVVALREGGRVQLANDWVVPHASVVERICERETTSLTDFVNRYGSASSATFDVDRQEVVEVTCATPVPTTTVAGEATMTSAAGTTDQRTATAR